MKIYVYGMNLMKEELKIINGILNGIKRRVEKEELEFDIIDLMSINEVEPLYPCIIFGQQTANQLEILAEEVKSVWIFPSTVNLIKKDKEATKKTKEKIEIVSAFFNRDEEELPIKEVKTETYIEKNNTTFGMIADIIITEKEAEYLKKIKDLLEGSKIVIKKGDITIEVS